MKNHHLPRIPNAVALVTLCLALSSCALLGHKPAVRLQTYTLDLDEVPAAANLPPPPGSLVLQVEMPHAAAGYDSTRMVYTRTPQTQEAFAQSVWADTPARMLAPLLVRQLQRGGGFRAVLLSPSAGRSDLSLDTTLLRLEQDFLRIPSTVHLRLQLTVMDSSTRVVVASTTVSVSRYATTDDAAGGAAAARLAVQAGLQQVAAFVQASAAPRPQRP
jgi:cholesterol transport system auxiliary component